MIARPEDLGGSVGSAGVSMCARTVLRVAAEVEAAESRIKDAILAAAQAGDCAKVIAIVTRWQTVPATEVLSPRARMPKPAHSAASGLDP